MNASFRWDTLVASIVVAIGLVAAGFVLRPAAAPSDQNGRYQLGPRIPMAKSGGGTVDYWVVFDTRTHEVIYVQGALETK